MGAIKNLLIGASAKIFKTYEEQDAFMAAAADGTFKYQDLFESLAIIDQSGDGWEEIAKDIKESFKEQFKD